MDSVNNMERGQAQQQTPWTPGDMLRVILVFMGRIREDGELELSGDVPYDLPVRVLEVMAEVLENTAASFRARAIEKKTVELAAKRRII